MKLRRARFEVLTAGLLTLLLASGPALAHHPMGGKLPGTLAEGLLSGFGHPIIGLDHLAAVVAVGCLSALHQGGVRLILGYVVAMTFGVALHLQGTTVPSAEALVALSVVALGAVMVWSRPMAIAIALVLFVATGLLHGYVLGEAIIGAERTPLLAYFAGLAAVQTLIAAAALFAVRLFADPAVRGLAPMRLIGVGIVCVGLVALTPKLLGG